jgi:hypothetical protein
MLRCDGYTWEDANPRRGCCIGITSIHKTTQPHSTFCIGITTPWRDIRWQSSRSSLQPPVLPWHLLAATNPRPPSLRRNGKRYCCLVIQLGHDILTEPLRSPTYGSQRQLSLTSMGFSPRLTRVSSKAHHTLSK